MEIQRDRYLKKLIARKHNGLIKVVTGLRRSGKSYLLFKLFKRHLLDEGVPEDHIIEVAFDMRKNQPLLDPDAMCAYVEQRLTDNKMYYILLDEVQMLRDFESVLNEFLHYENADVYVTGSNSKFLSSDVITEFRGRGDEVHVFPLSFSEFMTVWEGSAETALEEYYTYGGLPLTVQMQTDEQKSIYLSKLFDELYLKDIVDRCGIRRPQELEELLNILSSSVGSLTNPQKLANTFKTVKQSSITANTITKYCKYFEEAFLIHAAKRYDIKGKKYIGALSKYYFEDLGLRNARLNFRQIEETHLMENLIFNELRTRGYNVDVGIVEVRGSSGGKAQKIQTEVDFVANLGSKRCYIQSAFSIADAEKEAKEKRPLLHIPDSFKKIIVVKDNVKVRRDDHGFVTMGIREFLLNENSLDI